MGTIRQGWRRGAKTLRLWLGTRREQRLRRADLAMILARRDRHLLADIGLPDEVSDGDCLPLAGAFGRCCAAVRAERPRWMS